MPTEYFGPLEDQGFGVGPTFNYDKFKQWLEGQQFNFKKSFTVSGDIISANWDGASPLDLAIADGDASEGYALDTSEGAAQFNGPVFVESLHILSPTLGGEDVGFFNGVGAGTVLLSTGFARFAVTNALVVETSGGTGGIIHTSDGSASEPAYSFENDSDTGLYRTGNGEIAFSAAGSLAFRTSSNTNVAILLNRDGTNSLPAIGWVDDTNTGMYRPSADIVGIAAGGSQVVRFDSSLGTFFSVLGTTANAATAFLDPTTGRIRRSTSALKYKTDLQDADHLADIELKPMKFYREDDGRSFYGFIADWLGDQDELLGEYGAEGIENYDNNAVLAVLAAKSNALEKRIKRLEKGVKK